MSLPHPSRPTAVAGLLVALLLPFGIVGCGVSDDEQSVGTTTTTTAAGTATKRMPLDEWGASVCRAVTDWSEEFEQMGADFEADLETLDKGDVEGVRDMLADFFGQAADVTHDLGDDLEALGEPDLGQGEEIAKDLRKGISKVQGELTHTKNQVAELEVDNPKKFTDEIDRLSDEFQSALDEIGDALDDFESRYEDDGAAIDEVLRKDETCENANPRNPVSAP
jgi:hypothetical protein